MERALRTYPHPVCEDVRDDFKGTHLAVCLLCRHRGLMAGPWVPPTVAKKPDSGKS